MSHKKELLRSLWVTMKKFVFVVCCWAERLGLGACSF